MSQTPSAAVLAAIAASACTGPPDAGSPLTTREPCAERAPHRRALFGDLHVHTGFSFDAAAYGNTLTPTDAYRFARGESIALPPDARRVAQLDRPLDFAAVTDHGELLGEVGLCTTPGAAGYDSSTCRAYRDPEGNGALLFGTKMSIPGTPRYAELCGPGDTLCMAMARERWQVMRDAAETAYDRSERCEFTSFAAYEYTNTADVSNLHRNVVFANEVVPELPITMFEAPTPTELWRALDAECASAGTGCDVIVLPHNANLSNGQLFTPSYPPDASVDEQRELAALRQRMEPVVEIFQHKGDSECRNGFDGAEADPLCAFEKLRADGFEDCGDTPGAGGMRLGGCLHRLDFVRNVLKEGLREQRRLGVNPYRLGVIGSTDTHNGTPGHVASVDFPGHVGMVDDTPVERLGSGNVTHDGIINNPGGLAAVWAEENTREAIVAALRRRETFATSGPRIEVRLFGGWSLPETLCDRDPSGFAEAGYALGVPMGGQLSPNAGAAPSFAIRASSDRTPLARIQLVKGWMAADGALHERVFDVLQATVADDPVDPVTCEQGGGGLEHTCAVWTDPAFDATTPSFYYARVLELPTCRWSARECAAFEPERRPAGCDDPRIPPVVQQRAWTSPIWYDPAGP